MDLIIRVKMAPTWHIYSAKDGWSGYRDDARPGVAEGVVTEGSGSTPSRSKASDGQMVYEGSVEFRRRLRVGADAAPGVVGVGCEVGYKRVTRPHVARRPGRS